MNASSVHRGFLWLPGFAIINVDDVSLGLGTIQVELDQVPLSEIVVFDEFCLVFAVYLGGGCINNTEYD